jgi:hypothetical protein
MTVTVHATTRDTQLKAVRLTTFILRLKHYASACAVLGQQRHCHTWFNDARVRKQSGMLRVLTESVMRRGVFRCERIAESGG